ncbi:hypothetical protein [uncultured Desulfobacter sp.]|uniref:hypothetical protein n=1 Tax=uncultured Desulfobacter sp. TaxID=240139 RepID=UPI002AA7049A|nr:hypothetical protein [uncultured Desulfobacter sp.]
MNKWSEIKSGHHRGWWGNPGMFGERFLYPRWAITRMDIGCLFVRNASAGNRPGDRSEVSRGHSSPTPGVMAGTW